MATASIISAELRDWKRTTRYEPNEEEVAVLQKCRARESNLQSIGSLTGLGLGMLFFATGSPVCRALSLERVSGAVRGAGIFVPMVVGSGLGNSKAQSDCLKLMLPLQTPLGHQSRLLLRQHDPQSRLTRQFPVEEGIDSSEEATFEYTQQQQQQQQQQEEEEDDATTSSSSPSSTAALRRAQYKRAQLRRQLAGGGDGEEESGGQDAAGGGGGGGMAGHDLHSHAAGLTYQQQQDEEAAGDVGGQRREEVSAEALRRRRVKEALERRKAAHRDQQQHAGAWADDDYEGRGERARTTRSTTVARNNPYGDS
ncbi:uncharacterized protein ACA1_271330 [Acanthamoeba castellanii str. Neff]|uniref:Uncharacterized protein n=1 Tax=Acanthamoeba castellanii (strain ATCC 30010 / Neff) TaxID=1257118 RepID=L8GPP9_ACACF|nr:uncharacterized protein ACA1_271330 [Acanthamoeba castellanii str. Neff]ELR14598.1 hypothetical protein ACA1_271330 [Acanthamoeba castellanii str. Neff]